MFRVTEGCMASTEGDKYFTRVQTNTHVHNYPGYSADEVEMALTMKNIFGKKTLLEGNLRELEKFCIDNNIEHVKSRVER